MVKPEDLTPDAVRALLESARSDPDGFEQGATLVRHFGVWLQWDRDGRDRNEFNARRAARVIADAINARGAKP